MACGPAGQRELVHVREPGHPSRPASRSATRTSSAQIARQRLGFDPACSRADRAADRARRRLVDRPRAGRRSRSPTSSPSAAPRTPSRAGTRRSTRRSAASSPASCRSIARVDARMPSGDRRVLHRAFARARRRTVSRLLADAFRAYYRCALHHRLRPRAAQLVLLANLKIGFHEQTRLQPEITAAIDAGVDSARRPAAPRQDAR